MSVSRIGEFKANQGMTDALRDFMFSSVPMIYPQMAVSPASFIKIRMTRQNFS